MVFPESNFYKFQLLWLAPPKGSGCIKFKATVVESVDVWFSEDEELTKILCEEAPDTEDTQPKILKHCCTCDEAKYEVIYKLNLQKLLIIMFF